MIRISNYGKISLQLLEADFVILEHWSKANTWGQSLLLPKGSKTRWNNFSMKTYIFYSKKYFFSTKYICILENRCSFDKIYLLIIITTRQSNWALCGVLFLFSEAGKIQNLQLERVLSREIDFLEPFWEILALGPFR